MIKKWLNNNKLLFKMLYSIFILNTFMLLFNTNVFATLMKNDFEDLSEYDGYDPILLEAKKYYEHGNYENAILSLKKYIEKFPNSELTPDIYMEIALCEKEVYEKKRITTIENVIKTYETIIENYSLSDIAAKACYQLGQIYEKELKNTSEALKYYERCTVDYPSSSYSASSLYRMAQINEANGYYDMAIIYYQRLAHDFSKYQIAIDSLLKIKDIYLTKLTDNPKSLDKAFETFNELLTAYPNNKKTPEILMEYAKTIKEKTNDFEQAIKIYQQVIEKFPKDENAILAYEQIAKIYLENRDYKNLALTYIKLADEYKDKVNADKLYFEIAQIYEKDLKTYKKVRIDNKTYYKLEKSNFDEALKYYTKVVDNFPQSKYAPQALLKIAEILNNDLLRPTEAKIMYQALVEKYPDSKEYQIALERYNKMR